MLNMSVEKAKDELAALVKQVSDRGETIVLQTADGLKAALVNLALLPRELTQSTFADEQETRALAAADAVREKALARRHGRLYDDVSEEIETMREVRLLELQGLY